MSRLLSTPSLWCPAFIDYVVYASSMWLTPDNTNKIRQQDMAQIIPNAAILQPEDMTDKPEAFPRSRFPLTANPKVRGSVPRGRTAVAVSPRVESASGFCSQQQLYASQKRFWEGRSCALFCFLFFKNLLVSYVFGVSTSKGHLCLKCSPSSFLAEWEHFQSALCPLRRSLNSC